MKLLLDSCLSGTLKAPLQGAGHDVTWAGDWPADPGDEEILARAHEEVTVEPGRVRVRVAREP